MATHFLHKDDETLYFVTFTCFKWLPLFEATNSYDLVYKWFGILEKKGVRIYGFVIMPNHVHSLIYIPKDGENLNKLVGNGKRFMAYDLVKRLEKQRHTHILNLLKDGVQENERIKGKKHKVFRLSFDAKVCDDDEMIGNILEYIHTNPVSGKWQLVDDYLNYEHSSARFYEYNEDHRYCNLFHYRE